jgi:hypothetical protein
MIHVEFSGLFFLAVLMLLIYSTLSNDGDSVHFYNIECCSHMNTSKKFLLHWPAAGAIHWDLLRVTQCNLIFCWSCSRCMSTSFFLLLFNTNFYYHSLSRCHQRAQNSRLFLSHTHLLPIRYMEVRKRS